MPVWVFIYLRLWITMKRFLCAVLCLVTFRSVASHIVGGEFEILHLTDYSYRINLLIYFDEVNGLQANKTQDQFINAWIYQSSNNELIDIVGLPFVSIDDVH